MNTDVYSELIQESYNLFLITLAEIINMHTYPIFSQLDDIKIHYTPDAACF